jgi:hypothetical protein
MGLQTDLCYFYPSPCQFTFTNVIRSETNRISEATVPINKEQLTSDASPQRVGHDVPSRNDTRCNTTDLSFVIDGLTVIKAL